MKQKLNLYYSNKLYEQILISNNQSLAQKLGDKLIDYKKILYGYTGNTVTDWELVAKEINYPINELYSIDGLLNKKFVIIIKSLQKLAVSGEHSHPKYSIYYTHNKNIISQN